ncbi:MAG TPA: hypothetical protein VFM18_05125 [Methanosarcina sp.]|nr:hypothetical protein [Methanosarcina sp.]
MSDKIKHMFDGMIMSTEKKIIKRMVNRFLCWRLPENFSPDAGISFTPEFNKEYMASIGKPPMRHEPTGTNLLDAVQAEQMIRHILADELESFRAECVRKAVEEEREACAKICDSQASEWDSDAVQTYKNYAGFCASAILARSTKETT